MTRTIFQKISSSLWVLISFIPLFNGLGFVYIGNKYNFGKNFIFLLTNFFSSVILLAVSIC